MRFPDSLFQNISFPCPGCDSDDAPPGGRGFCPACTAKLHIYPDDMLFCPGCGGPHDGALAVCSQCLAEPVRLWQSAAAVFPYYGFGKKLIREFKFANRPEFARPFGALLAQAVSRSNFCPDVLVPVPLHFSSFWRRSYNQAELLAKVCGRELDIPVISALRRIHAGTKQAKLGRHERHVLKKSFLCVKPDKLKGCRVMLIDDVLTTGATLSAAAGVLWACGISELAVAVAARTPAFGAMTQ